MRKIKTLLGLALLTTSLSAFSIDIQQKHSNPVIYKSKYDSNVVTFMDSIEKTNRKDVIPPGDKAYYSAEYKKYNGEYGEIVLRQHVSQKFNELDRTEAALAEIKKDLQAISEKVCTPYLKEVASQKTPETVLDKVYMVNEQYLASGDEFVSKYKCNLDGTSTFTHTYTNPELYKSKYNPELVDFAEKYAQGLKKEADLKVISTANYNDPEGQELTIKVKQFSDFFYTEENRNVEIEKFIEKVNKTIITSCKQSITKFSNKKATLASLDKITINNETYFASGDKIAIIYKCN